MLRDKENDLLHLLTMLESLEKIVLFSREAEDAETSCKLFGERARFAMSDPARSPNGFCSDETLKSRKVIF